MSSPPQRRKRTAPKKRITVSRMPRAAPRRYAGTGDYKLYKAPKSIRPSPKTTESLGGTLGAYLGHGIHQVVKALTGFGDYTVQSNSLMPSPTLAGDPPIIRNTSNNSHIVHHREYITDVYANTAFTVQTFSINPGLGTSFPWVSQQADSYEQYRFRGLVYEFKSMSSDAVLSTSASSSLGTVIMSTQYNVLDSPFTDKRTMENYEFANSCKPSCSMLHPVECKMSQTSVSELYTRTGTVTTGDLRLYDLGNFSIAVQGMQNAANNQVIGELWCTYELEFFKPKLLIGGGALLTDHWAASIPTARFTAAAPLGTAGDLVLRSGSNIGTSVLISTSAPYAGGSIIFPAGVVDGTYLVTYNCIGSVQTVNSPAFGIGTTINVDVVSTSVKLLANNTASGTIAPNVGATCVAFTVIQVIKIIQTSPQYTPGFQFNFTGAFPTGTQTVDIWITQMSPSIN